MLLFNPIIFFNFTISILSFDWNRYINLDIHIFIRFHTYDFLTWIGNILKCFIRLFIITTFAFYLLNFDKFFTIWTEFRYNSSIILRFLVSKWSNLIILIPNVVLILLIISLYLLIDSFFNTFWIYYLILSKTRQIVRLYNLVLSIMLHNWINLLIYNVKMCFNIIDCYLMIFLVYIFIWYLLVYVCGYLTAVLLLWLLILFVFFVCLVYDFEGWILEWF